MFYINYWWVCAAGTLKPLAYTRPHLDAFCYPFLDKILKTLPYPRLAIRRTSITIVTQLIYRQAQNRCCFGN